MRKYKAQKFSQESYDKNDAKAKDIFVKWAESTGHVIVSDVENYKHDVITQKNGKNFAFELEMKDAVWKTKDTFPFDTVSFLGRKKRLHKMQPFYYVIISSRTGWAVMCDSSTIYRLRHREELMINGSERKGLDEMYRVPKDKCVFFNISK